MSTALPQTLTIAITSSLPPVGTASTASRLSALEAEVQRLRRDVAHALNVGEQRVGLLEAQSREAGE